ncbi:MAG: MFS transporter, partial [Opitutales bacterium]
ATAAVADTTSKEKRAAGMAVVGVAFGLGFIVGPAIGGFCVAVDLTELFPSLTAFGLNPFSTPALVACALSLLNLFWVARS